MSDEQPDVEQPEVVEPFDHLAEAKNATSFIREHYKEMPEDVMREFLHLAEVNALVSIAESLQKLVNPAPQVNQIANNIAYTPAYL